MTEKKKPAPKHVIRTSIPAYRFGSMKAADAQQKKRGTARTPSKLPTSLDDLNAKVKT
jgi:hypothetical protein